MTTVCPRRTAPRSHRRAGALHPEPGRSPLHRSLRHTSGTYLRAPTTARRAAASLASAAALLVRPQRSSYRTPVPPEPGLTATVTLLVSEADTAAALGSGTVAVLATPRVVRLAEEATVAALIDSLAATETSVGIQVQLDHLAPTPIGGSVTCEVTLEQVKGRRLVFTVSVNDDHGVVAVGQITRVVVDADRFMDKAQR